MHLRGSLNQSEEQPNEEPVNAENEETAEEIFLAREFQYSRSNSRGYRASRQMKKPNFADIVNAGLDCLPRSLSENTDLLSIFGAGLQDIERSRGSGRLAKL